MIKRVILWVAITLSPTNMWAMLELDEEKESYSLASTKAPTINTKDDDLPDPVTLTWEVMSDDVLIRLFSFFDVVDLGKASQVSRQWQRVAAEPSLWRAIGLRKYGEYLTAEDLKENPRDKVVSHFLSVYVNALINLDEITGFVRLYRLDGYSPSFKKNCPLIHANGLGVNLVELEGLKEEDKADFIAQGNKSAIEGKIRTLKDLQAIRDLNELLIEQGDVEATKRKIEALWHGGDTYYMRYRIPPNGRDYPGAEKKSPYETHRREYPTYGYAKNPIEAIEFIEKLAKQGSQPATELKIEGLADGKYGYEKNPTVARELNDILIEKGDARAIERKFEGLTYRRSSTYGTYYGGWEQIHPTTYGYSYDTKAIREFIDTLIEKGIQIAISRKIKGLADGEYGYLKNPAVARELNDILIENGDRIAISRKVVGLADGEYGYEKNPAAAKQFNESLVMVGDLGAIERKINGLLKGKYGYKQNFEEARISIESALVSGNNLLARGIGHYLKVLGLKYGLFGYERSSEQAIEHIKKYNVPF